MKMRVILVGLALAGLVSCGDSGPELDVAPADDAPDWDELRRRLNVLVRDSAGDESELTPTVFVEEVQAECASELGSSGPLKGCSGRFQASLQPHLPPSGAPSVCVEAMCDAQLRVCVANRLMELAETPRTSDGGRIHSPAPVARYTHGPGRDGHRRRPRSHRLERGGASCCRGSPRSRLGLREVAPR